MKNIILIAAGVIVGVAGVLFITQNTTDTEDTIINFDNDTSDVVVSNFEDCVNVGNPVMESYPRQCIHAGTTYIEELDIEDRPFPGDSNAKNFEDCISEGNIPTKSIPRLCTTADGETFSEEKIPGETMEILCKDEQRLADACIEIYKPVCASVQVECITEPCYPVKETFSNSCHACKNSRVISYIEGEC
jgi:hypothetical protein